MTWSSSSDAVRGAITKTGLRFHAPAVVLTAGTFLAGKIHIGETQYAAGRMGDPPSTALAHKLREGRFVVDRLKTGTPPRIDGRTLDYSVMAEQPGDDPRPVMSFMGSHADQPAQVSCWITDTCERTHQIIRDALHRSPLYSRPDRRHRPALLPVDRGQGGALRREGVATRSSSSPKGWTSARSIRTAFPPRCRSTCSWRWCAASAASSRRTSPAPATRSNTTSSIRAGSRPRWKPRRWRGCSSPARSTAPPVTRRPPRRACWPASMPRVPSASRRHGACAATRPTSACWSTT